MLVNSKLPRREKIDNGTSIDLEDPDCKKLTIAGSKAEKIPAVSANVMARKIKRRQAPTANAFIFLGFILMSLKRFNANLIIAGCSILRNDYEFK